MSTRANPTAIGAFVVGAIALAVAGLVILGGLEIFKKELPFVMFFEGSLGGLDVGAPVEIRGVKIGTVTRIRLFASRQQIGVYVNIDPSLLPKGTELTDNVQRVQDLIKQGLRAQLQTQSLLTGQLLVYLDYFPGSPILLTRLDPSVPEIPTVPTTLARLQARLESFLNKLEQVNLDQLTVAMTETLESARTLIGSREVKAAIISANSALQSADVALRNADQVIKGFDKKLDVVGDEAKATLVQTQKLIADAQKVLGRLDAQIEPLSSSLQTTSSSATDTLRSVDRAVAGDSRLGYEMVRALRDVADAARSLKTLADYLERHPDALIRGKGGPENK
ncbi:MAG TPA: MlaD family protein [Methylomirabilota bacterium]